MPNVLTGVEIRELSATADLDQLTRIFDDVWHPDPGNRLMGPELLRALSHAGNYVAGAYIGGRLAGGSVGFFAAPVGETLHSHITGVTRIGLGHNVGYALKLHQRNWARDRGLRDITWTFDPLVARNAFFTIAKLGASPIAYHRDFYGELGVELGGADESDRLLVSWPVDLPLPEGPAGETVDDLLSAGAQLGIEVADDDPQAVIGLDRTATVVIPVPRDIDAMRRTDPVAASRWRLALREALAPHFVAGAPAAVRFLRSAHYVVDPARSHRGT